MGEIKDVTKEAANMERPIYIRGHSLTVKDLNK